MGITATANPIHDAKASAQPIGTDPANTGPDRGASGGTDPGRGGNAASPSRSDRPRVSVIIATYKRGEFLVDTIPSILSDGYPDLELIVVDQTPGYEPSVQQRLDELLSRHPIRYIRLPRPNLPLARNVGLRASSGQVIVYVDDDVLLHPRFIEAHVSRYADASVGAVAGRVMRPDNILSDAAGEVGRVFADGSFTANFDRTTPCDCDWGAGCNMSFRRDVLERIGGFDERYIGSAYREDGDTFMRVKRAGLRVVFDPSASLDHLAAPGGGCRKDAEVARFYSFFRNDTLFFLNCMRLIHLPRFTLRVARWAWATYKVNRYTTRDLLWFATAYFAGAGASLFQRRDRLSRQLTAADIKPLPVGAGH